MQSQHVEYFLALAKYKNFSLAAERLYISQPSLSKHIRTLEDELGFKLFHRTNRGVELTPEGEIMYDVFSRCADTYQDSVILARNLKNRASHLTVAVLENMDTGEILKPLFDFQSRMLQIPITFTFVQLPYREIFYYLQSGRADLAISILDPHSPLTAKTLHVKTKHLLSTHNCLFYSINHPAAKQNPDHPLELSDFKNSVFFLPMYYQNSSDFFETKYSMQDYLSDLIGYTINIEYLESISSVVPNVESGHGAAILVNTCQIKKSSLIRSIPLDNQVSICLCWMEGNDNELVKTLIDNCNEYI